VKRRKMLYLQEPTRINRPFRQLAPAPAIFNDQPRYNPAMTNPFTRLSTAEIEHLNAFLTDRIPEDADASYTEDTDEGILGISELDGFFTAIVSGPVTVVPSQWLPAVWGDYEPVWNTEKEFQDIFTLMMRHMNGIATLLIEQPDDFEAIFLEQVVKEKTCTIVDEWCEGYLRGVALAAAQWDNAGLEMTGLLAPIRAFTGATHWRAHDLSEHERETIRKAIEPNVREIYAWWLARRAEDIAAMKPQRREPRVGRNDPCPCGSGKKYKKCCLH